MMKSLLGALVILWGLSGCTGAPSPSDSGEPAWLYNPGMAGVTGGVGSSRAHVRGRSAQRMTAISRALDEIARQMGVKVSTVLSTEAHAGGGSASTSMDSYSFQTTDGRTVKARIKEMWHDRKNGELYVWMVVAQ